MTGRLRIGALGCAEVLWRRLGPAFQDHPRTEITAVASRDPAKAARFAARFDCAATDYAGLLARADVDAVYLPAPPALHHHWGVRVLAAGKHLLVEKPLAATTAQARELIALARRRRLLLWENFLFPRHPQHEAARKLLAEGALGRLRSLHAAFCFPPRAEDDIRYVAALGGGALLDAGVYPLRAAQLLLGPGLRVAGASLRMDRRRGVDLSGQALLVSPDGVLAGIEFGFEHSYAARYTLWGSAARLHVDRAFTPPPDHPPVLRLRSQDGTEHIPLPPSDQVAGSVGAFAEAVLAGTEANSPAERARGATAVETVWLTEQIRLAAVRVPAEAEVPETGGLPR
ncbi:Gfo/Idh/MocA family oxidoreductase [Crossiella sp. SN42]|uniref:Gfo/Idh/MocA family protein n=1 Tax=Crossiella sp. SN42 TaxID=2944808 RepID=UPI00207C57F9|nr:Gfo/Idh/MocA family oxidoreductase [Crossiella sp. SN42]MCO1580359.1 Gfo/Idh/MocA family oxidoreductase [Crossiella sp. SN42]